MNSLDKNNLIKQKNIVDQKQAILKSQLTEAKAEARINGKFMPPAKYAQLELDVKSLARKSQEIQNKLAELRRAGTGHFNDYFREAAALILPQGTLVTIIEMAHDIKRQRELN